MNELLAISAGELERELAQVCQQLAMGKSYQYKYLCSREAELRAEIDRRWTLLTISRAVNDWV
jgi:hypothetical protein